MQSTISLEWALSLLNQMRALHAASPVDLSPELIAYAENFASNPINRPLGALVHSGGPYGENLAVVYGPQTAVDALHVAICMWYNERYQYNILSPGFYWGTAHFTAIVWVSTLRVGLAVVQWSDGGYFVVAEFDPPGNYVDQFATQVMPPSGEMYACRSEY